MVTNGQNFKVDPTMVHMGQISKWVLNGQNCQAFKMAKICQIIENGKNS